MPGQRDFIILAGAKGPCRFLEQSVRDFCTSSAAKGLVAPVQQEEISEENLSP